MRFYYQKPVERIGIEDIVKFIVFISIFITGLMICPRGDIYSIANGSIRSSSIGVYMMSMSIIYFFMSLIERSIWNIAVRWAASIIIIACAAVSIVIVSGGGAGIAIGISILGGIMTGALISRIV